MSRKNDDEDDDGTQKKRNQAIIIKKHNNNKWMDVLCETNYCLKIESGEDLLVVQIRTSSNNNRYNFSVDPTG